MTLLDDLLGYDPEFDLEDDDPPADHWAIAKALEQADQLLAKLDLATVEPLLGQLRDAAGGSRYCGYLALLTQGRISPLAGGRAYHAMGRARRHLHDLQRRHDRPDGRRPARASVRGCAGRPAGEPARPGGAERGDGGQRDGRGGR